MPDVLTRLYGPTFLTNSAATKYTATSVTAVIRSLHVCNETATTRHFTLSIGTDGGGKRLFHEQPVPPGDPFDWTGSIVLEDTDTIQALAETNSALTLTISGVEVS
jgi:hypothetical protein